MESEINIRAYREPWANDSISLRILKRDWLSDSPAPVQSVATQITFTQIDTPGTVLPAAIHLTPGEATQLLDELWRAGIRPTDGTGSVGQLGATQAHLQDMRAIVFKLQANP